MKRDAFDDVRCPFNYTAELQKARDALNLKVGTFISENPSTTYRDLARMFGISAATLCAIAKPYCRERKPGRRSITDKVAFEVRSNVRGKKMLIRVTVISAGARSLSIASVRSLVVALYRTDDVSISRGDAKPDREVDFTIRELEEHVARVSVTKEKLQDAVP